MIRQRKLFLFSRIYLIKYWYNIVEYSYEVILLSINSMVSDDISTTIYCLSSFESTNW